MGAVRIGVAFFLAGVLLATSSFAASMYDPELEWRTVHSPRFAVHYPDGAKNLALRMSRVSEEVMDDICALFGFVPEGTIEIVLSDAVDFANGSAQVMPKNIIRLYVAAPTELTGLSSYEDWIRILLIHEISHIVDIDQTWGLTRFARWIFGKYISMNGFTPQFFSEGVAVYAETLLTSTGRGRSTYVDMMLRTAALEDRFLGIDQANILYSDWPGGSAAYYYGGRFHLWLGEKFGRESVRALHQFNAAMPIPYFYWPGAMWIFGSSLPQLWDQWRQELVAQGRLLQERLVKEGMTESRRLTHHGRNIAGAQYSSDGEYILYSRSSPVDGATVRRVNRDGSDDRFLVLQTFSPRFSFEKDGGAFYFSQSAVNERFNSFNDLYRYEIASKKSTRLRDVDAPKKSLRARSPDVSSDGKRLVFVQNRLHQNWVSIGDFVENEEDPTKPATRIKVRTLIAPYGDMQHASPRFSPDGARVVVSTWFPGGHRDLIIVDAETGELQHRVSNDMSLDGNPTWSPDGRFLLYESDRDGISNIYGYELATRKHFRVTRVIGGAFQPDVSPNGEWLLFRNCSGIGFDIHEMPYDPSGWEELESGSVSVADPMEGAGMIASKGVWRADEASWELGPSERDAPYSPWSTLLPFQDNWLLLPGVFWMNDDPTINLLTLGGDVLGEHGWAASLGTSYHTQTPNWSVAYANDAWYPTFSMGVRDYRVSLERGAMGTFEPLEVAGNEGKAGSDYVYGASWRELQRTRGSTLAMSLPIKQRHFVGFSHHFERRTRRALISYRRDLRAGESRERWETLTGRDYGDDERSGGPLDAYPGELGDPFVPFADAQFNQGCFGTGTPGRCDFSWVEVGYSYNHSRVFPYSVSPEHGKALGVSAAYYSKALGGDFDELLLNFDGSLYVNNPLWDNHVLAMRVRGAIALGPDFEETFLLGGDYLSSLFQATTARTFPLRGFSLKDVEKKTGVLATYLEYRFPLWHLERGIGTLPVYFERLHGAFFMEGGNSFGTPGDTDLEAVAQKGWNRLWGGKVSVGAEVRASLKLGWAFPLTLRFGVALPVVNDGLLRAPGPVPILPSFLVSIVGDASALSSLAATR